MASSSLGRLICPMNNEPDSNADTIPGIPTKRATTRVWVLGLIVVVASAVILSLVWLIYGKENEKDLWPGRTNRFAKKARDDAPDGFVYHIALEPLRPIKQFKIQTVQEVQNALNPDELVIGVTVNGESRAYPINCLTGPSREILNDKLGGVPIAATW
jgi:hypothetical protein